MVDVDLNNDNIDELILLRAAETSVDGEAQIVAEIYQFKNGDYSLSASQSIYNVSFCSASKYLNRLLNSSFLNRL